MVTLTRNDFLTSREWFRNALAGQQVVLRNASALECLEMFDGYLHGGKIDVFALEKGEYENINYCVLLNFDGLDIVRFGDLYCTSFTQTVNQMLADYDNCDEEALLQALSNYYYDNNESFDELVIEPTNSERFNLIKEWAIDYYTGG